MSSSDTEEYMEDANATNAKAGAKSGRFFNVTFVFYR